MWGESKPVFRHDPPHQEMGELDLGISVSGGKSIATKQYHQGALKIIRPHYLDDSGQVYYTIANPGGGYVGGDAYRIGVEVDAGASILFTDQSAAKVYRTPNDFVVQNIAFTLHGDAVMEYIPDQLILYRDADYRQEILVEMDKESSLFISDIVTPGWSPDGGQFLYKNAHLRTAVKVDGEVVLVDNIRIEPTKDVFSTVRSSFLGEHTHFSTAICVDPHVSPEVVADVRNAVRQHLEGKGSVKASVTEIDVPGFVLRAVGDWTEDLMRVVQAAANVVRDKTRGQGPINLRQY
ncbi:MULTISPECIES: urease accessory protein UreD [Corynebacterium]|uniref:Urease accessory protein UreD n=1 Tax=Corynebacterium glucuronolyticum TaxID=39791 RepID=A0A7T4JWD5_9CORY|nr:MULTISPECIES: urease accessory protein UreD [Corynebacterium]EEI27382.1 urease accessory protein UreD [Corynebacterium glucuronolyticum ATCC 51867]MCT1441658.1 urease accessory protein UreD [Corynebacterium glucuronolyticum]OFO42941.1 urease accessory protein UreD [Corynebacterium sp. HMSC073D01]QQB47776.1 urease accessory protein UreD [Corynebacterium glucuronolyticum]QQU87583.1 urease accessory protein UreD [Corynebacterium glucuronolyticum]